MLSVLVDAGEVLVLRGCIVDMFIQYIVYTQIVPGAQRDCSSLRFAFDALMMGGLNIAMQHYRGSVCVA